MNADDLCGTVLGTCTLQKVIGRGGMGAVYLAQQSRPRRQVAVKVLLPVTTLQPHQQKAFLERFRRETDAAASLEHPNITPVHEYGEREGLAYLVMAYVSGGTLRDELETEGKLPLTRIVNYLEQMAAALDFAHERKVVHRDIKPANILMTPEKRLLLTDFGLVKIMIDGQNQNPLSEVGMPMGTPDYMSPEQVIGAEVDARTDIYSLGVLLYHMVTGSTPFQGETPMKVALQHVHMPPPLPRLSRPDLPPAAEQVILRALTKRPADRYMTARDLATTFRLALEAAGVQVDISGMGNEERGSGNRRRGLFDPVWRSSMPQVHSEAAATEPKNTPHSKSPGANQPAIFEASKSELPRRDIIAQTSMPMPSFSGILTEENTSRVRQPNGLLYGSDMMPQMQQDNASIGLASEVQPKAQAAPPQVQTPLPPVYEASPERQPNISARRANPQSEQGFNLKPAHRLLFSPANLRPGYKTNIQNNQPGEQDTRHTDKRPAFSAQSMRIQKLIQPENQATASPSDTTNDRTGQLQDPTANRYTGINPQGTLLHPTGRFGTPHKPTAPQSDSINHEPTSDKSHEGKTDSVSLLLQKVRSALPTRPQLNTWLAQLQREPWQEHIKNNKRKLILIGLVLLVVCIIAIVLISHAAGTSSSTGFKPYGYELHASTQITTAKMMDGASITLVYPCNYHVLDLTVIDNQALKAENFSLGINGQLGGS